MSITDPAPLPEPKDLQDWVRHYFANEHFLGRVSAGGTLLLGVVVLSIDFLVFYVLFYIFGGDMPRYVLIMLSLLGLAALFVGHAFQDRIFPGEALDDAGRPPRPDWQRLLFWICPIILFKGPEFFAQTWRTYLRIENYKTGVDLQGCAAVLNELMANTRRVELSALQASLPEVNLDALMPYLQQIQGIQFMTNTQPPGVMLTPTLRDELRNLHR